MIIVFMIFCVTVFYLWQTELSSLFTVIGSRYWHCHHYQDVLQNCMKLLNSALFSLWFCEGSQHEVLQVDISVLQEHAASILIDHTVHLEHLQPHQQGATTWEVSSLSPRRMIRSLPWLRQLLASHHRGWGCVTGHSTWDVGGQGGSGTCRLSASVFPPSIIQPVLCAH